MTPLWWRRPETVSPEVDGDDSVALSECSFLSDPMRALLQKQGLERLFSVQSRVIPAVLESYRMPFLRPRDICVCTPTGTGKTFAYLIPVLEVSSKECLIFLPICLFLTKCDVTEDWELFRNLVFGPKAAPEPNPYCGSCPPRAAFPRPRATGGHRFAAAGHGARPSLCARRWSRLF